MKHVWIAFFVFATSLGAQSERVDEYVSELMRSRHIPGVSVGIVQGGKTVWAKGYGLANVEHGTRASADTVYEILSITKQFTAAALLLLVDEGKISLDQKILEFLPEYPPSWGDVTIRHLLTHTSGIHDYTDIPPFLRQLRIDATPQELLLGVKERPLQFKPGSQWRYSNSNYVLLGLAIEKAGGRKYGEFLRERIFEPLEMKATRLTDYHDLIPQRAGGYIWIGDEAESRPAMLTGFHGPKNVIQNAIYISPTRKWAAGAIASSVNDLIRWDLALRSDTLFKKALREQMWTPAVLETGEITRYGFGNELRQVRGHRIAGHHGGGMAFNCTLYRLLDDDLTVVVLCNQTDAPSKGMAARIASFYLPDLVEQEMGIEDVEPEVTALVGKILMDAAQRKVDASLFSPGAQQTAKLIERVGRRFLLPAGELKTLTLVDRQIDVAQRNYRYRAKFENNTMMWTVSLSAEGKIAGFQPDEE